MILEHMNQIATHRLRAVHMANKEVEPICFMYKSMGRKMRAFYERHLQREFD